MALRHQVVLVVVMVVMMVGVVNAFLPNSKVPSATTKGTQKVSGIEQKENFRSSQRTEVSE